jgi:hypothetical protein
MKYKEQTFKLICECTNKDVFDKLIAFAEVLMQNNSKDFFNVEYTNSVIWLEGEEPPKEIVEVKK